MRNYLMAISLSVLLGLGSGYGLWCEWDRPRTAGDQVLLIPKMISDFQQSHQAIHELAWSQLADIPAELTNPRTALPHFHHLTDFELNVLHQLDQSCRQDLVAKIGNPQVKKAALWQLWLCARQTLPGDFFVQPPFMHPSGKSYVRMAEEKWTDSTWRKQHVNYLHISERDHSAWQNEVSTEQRAVAQLSLTGLEALRLSNPLILSARYVWIQSDGAAPEHRRGVRYQVYLRKDWDRYGKKQPTFTTGDEAQENCVKRDLTLCWQASSAAAKSRLYIFAALNLASLLALLAALSHLIWQWSRSRRLDFANRRFILQTLAHELRTPATSLQMSVDFLRRDFDRVSPDGQSAFLRICDDVQRLQKLIHRSNNYLMAFRDGRQLVGELRELPSVNGFFSDQLEIYRDRNLVLQSLPQDQKLLTDPFWLELCVKNLIDNAFQHGEPPVRVSLRSHDAELIVEIADQGQCPQLSLSELTRDFHKGPHSTGLGLGLSLVARAAQIMKWRFELSGGQTTFRLHVGGLL